MDFQDDLILEARLMLAKKKLNDATLFYTEFMNNIEELIDHESLIQYKLAFLDKQINNTFDIIVNLSWTILKTMVVKIDNYILERYVYGPYYNGNYIEFSIHLKRRNNLAIEIAKAYIPETQGTKLRERIWSFY